MISCSKQVDSWGFISSKLTGTSEILADDFDNNNINGVNDK